jgi:hypothetical protein
MPGDAELVRLVRLVRRPSSPIRLRSWSGELAEMREAGEEANGSRGRFLRRMGALASFMQRVGTALFAVVQRPERPGRDPVGRALQGGQYSVCPLWHFRRPATEASPFCAADPLFSRPIAEVPPFAPRSAPIF